MRTLIALGCVSVLPFLGSDYLTNLLIIVMLHAMPALGVSLLMGYTGQISLGHAAFYGLGAYGAAAFSVHMGLNPWISIVLAVILVGVTSSYLGWVIFRLRGHYLAVATLGFGFIVNIAFVCDWSCRKHRPGRNSRCVRADHELPRRDVGVHLLGDGSLRCPTGRRRVARDQGWPDAVARGVAVLRISSVDGARS